MGCQQNPCAGCGKNACCSACGQAREIRIRRKDADFLLRFAELPFLPAVRFSLRRLNGSSSESDCLAPVFLSAPSETLPDVCQTAGILTRPLEQKLISVSYTEPLERFNYSTMSTLLPSQISAPAQPVLRSQKLNMEAWPLQRLDRK